MDMLGMAHIWVKADPGANRRRDTARCLAGVIVAARAVAAVVVTTVSVLLLMVVATATTIVAVAILVAETGAVTVAMGDRINGG
jgi:hypothetical protein